MSKMLAANNNEFTTTNSWDTFSNLALRTLTAPHSLSS
jgi:hypothetical protein